METILEYFSSSVKEEIKKYLVGTLTDTEIEEIRLRAEKPMVIKKSSQNVILDKIITQQELLEIFQKVCEHSIYSYQKQICEGFITVKGGHRVGITGNCVIDNGKMININYISSLNFRIAREKKNCSNKILKYVINEQKEITNTIIASKPGCGKTTILRDLIRNLSTGNSIYNIEAKTIGVVDERGEIASMYKGVPQNDLGILSDVLNNISKSNGMRLLIRSMSPDIIACDEIGSKEDIEAINYAVCSGVKGIFTIHGENLKDLLLNKSIKDLLEKDLVDTIIFLDDKTRGEIKEVYKLNKENKTYIKVLK